MGYEKTKKMDSSHGQPATNSVRPRINAPIRPEKIDFHINETIRIYPQQIASIIESFKAWSSQWEI
jgi:hypothetical protein